MGRRTAALALCTLMGAALVVPAAAQFGNIFGEPPPRPPGSVPGGRQQPPQPPPQPPAAYPPQGPYGNYPPPQDTYRNPPPGNYGGIQSRPLPPPPGAEPAARAPAAEPAVSAVSPAARPPRGGAQPADTSPQPGDEVAAEPPSQKIANTGALFSGLDKITGRIINFDVAIGETVQFGALQLTPRACYTRPATEASNTDAFVEVDEVTLQGEIKRIFTGWMFASSPGLHAVEHPIYDIWLTDCKGATVTAEKPQVAEPPPPAQPAPRTQQRRAQPRQPVRPPQQNIPQFR